MRDKFVISLRTFGLLIAEVCLIIGAVHIAKIIDTKSTLQNYLFGFGLIIGGVMLKIVIDFMYDAFKTLKYREGLINW